MTREYTPTDQQVIDDYMPDEEDIGFDARTMSMGEWKRLKVAAFDRWLAAHDAQIRAEAWDEGHRRGWMDGVENAEPASPNPYRKENYLYKSNGLQREEQQ
jgi:hypothetical protein